VTPLSDSWMDGRDAAAFAAERELISSWSTGDNLTM